MYDKAIEMLNDILLDGMQKYKEIIEDMTFKYVLSNDMQRQILDILDTGSLFLKAENT